jgi:hypothetical protein
MGLSLVSKAAQVGLLEVSQLCCAVGSGGTATFAADMADYMSQPGNAWPEAWKVLETPPSLGACGSSLTRMGYSLSSLHSCIFEMFAFLSGLELVLCPPETNTKHTYTYIY